MAKQGKAQRESKGKPPVMKFRAGGVEASVWENSNDQGTWYNVTVRKSYQDDKGDWQESSSFGVKDTLALAGVLQAAGYWMLRKQASDDAPEGQSDMPF